MDAKKAVHSNSVVQYFVRSIEPYKIKFINPKEQKNKIDQVMKNLTSLRVGREYSLFTSLNNIKIIIGKKQNIII